MTDEAIIAIIAKSFEQEVRYIQGDIYSLSYETRRLRWMSLHTVAGMLAVNFNIKDHQSVYYACGFDNIKIRSYAKEGE